MDGRHFKRVSFFYIYIFFSNLTSFPSPAEHTFLPFILISFQSSFSTIHPSFLTSMFPSFYHLAFIPSIPPYLPTYLTHYLLPTLLTYISTFLLFILSILPLSSFHIPSFLYPSPHSQPFLIFFHSFFPFSLPPFLRSILSPVSPGSFDKLFSSKASSLQ